MSGSAVALLVFGLAALFFPELAADALGHGATVPVQLFGGALLGFAFLNWMGRSAILGGIYGRPIVVGNFGLGVITAGTSISASFDGRLPQWGWALAAIFMIHALGFFRLMRRPPWDSGARAESDRGSG